MKANMTKGQIKDAFIKYIEEPDLISLTKALKHVPVKAVSRNNLARLRFWGSKLDEMQSKIKEMLHEIINDYKKYLEFPPVVKPRHFKNTEESFKKLQSFKTPLTVRQYVRRSNAHMHRGYYAEVEAVLWYGQYYYIFVIKDGQQWCFDDGEYGPGRPTKKKYVLLADSDIMVESDDLEEVERGLLKMLVRDKV